jgi:hypothetical protein
MLALAALAVPSAAGAAPSPELWATVNICDTAGTPDAMGVRAAMPGDATRERMFVRFNAQWWSSSRRRWLAVRGNPRSPWIYVGRARFESRQAGWTFRFGAPSSPVLLRAVADFEWRARKASRHGHAARWIAVMRRRRVTRAGVLGADGGDPPGTSLATCSIG